MINKERGTTMAIYNSSIDLVGNTPLVRLGNIEKAENLTAVLVAKLELFNPTGSIKDRTAKAMIEDAETKGKLIPGSTIIEPTSGNTGIALAAIAAAKGYKIILTMPETMSVERRKLFQAYGAELVLTAGDLGMKGAIDKAEELDKTTPNSFMPGQFNNPVNPQVHIKSTGPEIWNDTDGKVDILIAGIGTGGTITGTGEYLKTQNPDIKIIAVEPAGSPVLSGGKAGPHKLEGIGAGFIPKILNTTICDEIITVKDEDAYKTTRNIAANEGILVGTSSGAATWAAIEVAKRQENSGKTIVIIFPDTGERYLSTPLFDQ